MSEGVVRPVVTRKTPRLGPVAFLIATQSDLEEMRKRIISENLSTLNLFTSRLIIPDNRVSLCGPMVGAPYAVMILETLVAWGVRDVVFLGWCGSLSPEVQIGDLVVPTGAWIDEGTSSHYGGSGYVPSDTGILPGVLRESSIPFHEGDVWTTDAIFRETPEKISRYQQQGVLGVEMEYSALLTVSRFHRVRIHSLLVVSDSVADLVWKPGFRDERFHNGRKTAVDTMVKLCQTHRRRPSDSGSNT
jgi:purine-nucleoside phosphorylase